MRDRMIAVDDTDQWTVDDRPATPADRDELRAVAVAVKRDEVDLTLAARLNLGRLLMGREQTPDGRDAG